MLSSAIAYFLIFVISFTVLLAVAFLFRILLVLTASRLYFLFSKDNSPQNILSSSIRFVQPAGFLSSIFHGYSAVWMGIVILGGMGISIDWFLAVFLGTSFLLFGLRRLNRPANVRVGEEAESSNRRKVNEETTLIIDPALQQANPMEDMQQEMKNQLKGKMQDFMQGNAIVGMIGKLTGVALAAVNYITF